MKLVLLVLTGVFALAKPLPIDDPNDQVELVPRQNTNSRIPEEVLGGAGGGVVPILVVDTSDSPQRGRVPLLGSSGFFPFFETILSEGIDRDEERIPAFPPRIKEIDLRIDQDALFPPALFGGGGENGSEKGGDRRCGVFCAIFRTLGTQLKDIEEQLKETQANRKNELEDGDEPQPQTTYEEKVLPDGTVVKIRKTSYSDAGDDGTSYFGYHSTSVVSTSEDNADEEDASAAEQPAPSDEQKEEVEEVEVKLDEGKAKPIKLIKQDNDSILKRRRRQATSPDPFNQQVEDVSYYNQISQNPFNQVVVPQQRVVYVPTTLAARGRAPPPKPVSLAGDTRVNDLLLQNARRGGLIRLEPDAEFIDGVPAVLT